MMSLVRSIRVTSARGARKVCHTVALAATELAVEVFGHTDVLKLNAWFAKQAQPQLSRMFPFTQLNSFPDGVIVRANAYSDQVEIRRRR